MNSFYTCFPGGEAFGNNVLDLDQNAATNITGQVLMLKILL